MLILTYSYLRQTTAWACAMFHARTAARVRWEARFEVAADPSTTHSVPSPGWTTTTRRPKQWRAIGNIYFLYLTAACWRWRISWWCWGRVSWGSRCIGRWLLLLIKARIHVARIRRLLPVRTGLGGRRLSVGSSSLWWLPVQVCSRMRWLTVRRSHRRSLRLPVRRSSTKITHFLK